MILQLARHSSVVYWHTKATTKAAHSWLRCAAPARQAARHSRQCALVACAAHSMAEEGCNQLICYLISQALWQCAVAHRAHLERRGAAD